jgi:hypothetical protein
VGLPVTIELRSDNARGVTAAPIGRMVAPRFTEGTAPELAEPRPARISTTCAQCNWPEVCLGDGTCWESVRAEREAAQQAKRARPPIKEEEQMGVELDQLAELEAEEPQSPNGAVVEAAGEQQCKREGCTSAWVDARGRFSKLCAEHKAEAVAQARTAGSFSGLKRPAARAPKPAPARRPAPKPKQPVDSWDDLRGLAGALRNGTVTLNRWKDDGGDEERELGKRLLAFLESHDLTDRRQQP